MLCLFCSKIKLPDCRPIMRPKTCHPEDQGEDNSSQRELQRSQHWNKGEYGADFSWDIQHTQGRDTMLLSTCCLDLFVAVLVVDEVQKVKMKCTHNIEGIRILTHHLFPFCAIGVLSSQCLFVKQTFYKIVQKK